MQIATSPLPDASRNCRGNPFAEAASKLLAAGYSPLRANGKACLDRDWPRRAIEPYDAEAVDRFARSPLRWNVAIALGFRDVVAVDRDTDCPRVRAALHPIFARMHGRGGVPVAKIGAKGATTFWRWTGGAWRNRKFKGASAVLLELSGAGCATVVPPSWHPDVDRPYRWTTRRTLLDTTPDELPALLPEDVRAIEEALAPFAPAPRSIATFRPTLTAAMDERAKRRQAAYARGILDRECAALAAMGPKSGRNRRAFEIACRLGRWLHHGIVPPPDIVRPLLEACAANGLVAEDGRGAVLATIASGLAKGRNDALPDLEARQ
jgi:hypothetical protein